MTALLRRTRLRAPRASGRTCRRSRWATWRSARRPTSARWAGCSRGRVAAARHATACPSTTGWARPWSCATEGLTSGARAASSSSAGAWPGLAAGYYLARGGLAGHRGRARARRWAGSAAASRATASRSTTARTSCTRWCRGSWTRSAALLGDRLIEHKKKNRIRLLGRYLDYPLQPRQPAAAPRARCARRGWGLGYAGAMAGGVCRPQRARRPTRTTSCSASAAACTSSCSSRWPGRSGAIPKLLSADLARARIPSGGAAELILRLLKLKETTEDVDAPFFYYPRGGFGVFPERLAEEIRAGGRPHPDRAPRRVALERDGARVTRGGRWRRTAAASGCPARRSSRRSRSRRSAGLLLPGRRRRSSARRARCACATWRSSSWSSKQDRLVDDHWIFFPERATPSTASSSRRRWTPASGPKGRTAVCCDLTCDEGDADLERARRRAGASAASTPLVEAGLTTPDSFEGGLRAPLPSFYPMYTVDYRERLRPRLRAAARRATTWC